MLKKLSSLLIRLNVIVFLCSICTLPVSANEKDIPEPFRGDTPSSSYTIQYDDIDVLFGGTVLSTGMSTRAKAKEGTAEIGSRIKSNVKTLTALEGNRFFFEAFETEKDKAVLTKIREDLESLPTTAPLKHFHKSEQLAYWLNLYNITLLDELVKRYPIRDLEDLFDGKKSILNQKLLTVSGIKLSLNDIHHKILMPKFDNDPLIMYGLYQGIIGGPNIRREAYKGDTVFSALKENAYEFVNSNRGTYADKGGVFRVSILYERNEDYFPDYKKDLKAHLYKYIIGDMGYYLDESKRIRANISNWDITDVYGTMRKSTSSAATSEAALLDIGKGNQELLPDEFAGGGFFTQGALSDTFSRLSPQISRFTPEQLAQIQALHFKAADSSGRVEVTDIETDENANEVND